MDEELFLRVTRRPRLIADRLNSVRSLELATETRKLVISGTHVSVKITNTLTNILSNIHPKQPMKGTMNPPHVQVKLPPSIAKKLTGK